VHVPQLDHPLDDATWAALDGAHAPFADRSGAVARYQEDVAPFAGFAPGAPRSAWDELAGLSAPGAIVVLPGTTPPVPEGFVVVEEIPGLQMVGDAVEAAHDDEALILGAEDVPEMIDLVSRTEPGPFRIRTIELGSYLGIRHDGALVAMGGERMHPDGYVEVSAVCTDPAYRGSGLASRLVRAVSAGIVARGERPFLHVASANVGAIRLYRSLGFAERLELTFRIVRTPGRATG
jgi:ribosomal protein S18 acetylase RimI-like enzyme